MEKMAHQMPTLRKLSRVAISVPRDAEARAQGRHAEGVRHQDQTMLIASSRPPPR